ncbi:MAG: hypothetical protein HYT08_03985 [Candidatus Levybacteria bacterium]|nr:hypothetical protein [Candidatus Levybacteria bacterium]
MKEIAGQTPFKESLIPFSDSETLYTFGNNRSFVVRKGPFETIKGYPLYEIDIAMALFQNLENDYGIAVVPFSAVVGLDENGQISAFTIAEKVEGKCLSEASIEEKEARKFFSLLLEYHTDIFENGGFLIYDLNDDDFSYGHTKKDPADKIYLTDLDPYYELITSFNPQVRKRNFVDNLETLSSILSNLERTSSGHRESRNDLISFLQRIRSSFHIDDRTTIDQLIGQNQRLPTEGTEED